MGSRAWSIAAGIALGAGLLLLIPVIAVWATWQDVPGGPAQPPTSESGTTQLVLNGLALLVIVAALVFAVLGRRRPLVIAALAGLFVVLLVLVTLGQPAFGCVSLRDCTYPGPA